MSADALLRAVVAEARVRSLPSIAALIIPPIWGRAYAKEAKDVPYCSDYRTVERAAELMRSFIDPALHGEASGLTWSPAFLAWT